MPPATQATAEPLSLVPGDALGPFRLGSLLFNVLNRVRSFRATYPSAKVAWDDQAPSSSPLHLTLTSPPLHLTFSPLSQRLERIELRGPDPAAWVSYRGKRLRPSPGDRDFADRGGGGDEDDADVVKTVRRVLGPTYGSSKAQVGKSGHEEEEILSYPGVAFGVLRTATGSTMSRIIVTALPAPCGVPVDQAWLHPVLPDSPAVAQGDLRVAEIHLDGSRRPAHVQLHFHQPPPASSASPSAPPSAPAVTAIPPVVLCIGETTSEDVLCELGAAIRTFWKEDDRLTIHTASVGGDSGGRSSDAALEPNPYFLSYPHLGLTLLLSSSPSSSTPHCLVKVILHSNLPGEVQFGRTARARCVLLGANAGAERVGIEEGWEALREFLSSSPGRGAGRSPAAGAGAGTPIKSELDLRDGADDRPMILDRTAADGSRDGVRVRGKTTEIHGFPGIAVEVTGSGDIETVWLF